MSVFNYLLNKYVKLAFISFGVFDNMLDNM